MCPGWDAHLAADDVSHIGRERGWRTRLVAARDLQRHREQDSTLVAVVDQGSGGEAGWHGPPNIAGPKAWRDVPLDVWRVTRIPRIHPVDVPAALEVEEDPDPRDADRKSTRLNSSHMSIS